MLIVTSKHTPRALAKWRAHEREDAVWSQLRRYRSRVADAHQAVEQFVAGGGVDYVSVSWGKDSVVAAHIVLSAVPDAQLVWLRIEPVVNPDCFLVRDAFLRLHPRARYDEIVIHYRPNESRWHTHFGPQKTGEAPPAHRRGFAVARKRYGPRYTLGVRADESEQRRIRMHRWGHSSLNACAPIGWWSLGDVFAYLHEHHLPVHPAYAYTDAARGLMYGREGIRVDALWGPSGGDGRREWERHYYPEQYRAMQRWCEAQVAT